MKTNRREFKNRKQCAQIIKQCKPLIREREEQFVADQALFEKTKIYKELKKDKILALEINYSNQSTSTTESEEIHVFEEYQIEPFNNQKKRNNQATHFQVKVVCNGKIISDFKKIFSKHTNNGSFND